MRSGERCAGKGIGTEKVRSGMSLDSNWFLLTAAMQRCSLSL